MLNKSFARLCYPAIAIFFVLTGIFMALKGSFEAKGIDTRVVMVGNLILFLVSAFALYLYHTGLNTTSTQKFLRSVYSATLLKLVICIIAAFAYIFAAGDKVNKPALFICMGIYLVYTIAEMRGALQINKALNDRKELNKNA